MRTFAAVMFCSAVIFAPALAAAQAATAPVAQLAEVMQLAEVTPAAPITAPVQTTNESASVNLDEIVCKSEAPATGTRLGGGRECHTVREWNEREKRAQDTTRMQQRQAFASGEKPN